jgi:hypothetical protein
MQREDDQELWDLLGSASQPTVSPFFSRDVTRRIREGSSSRGGVRPWFNWRRLLPVSTIAAATAAIFIAYTYSFRSARVDDDDPVAKIDVQDYDVVADLDELLALDENSLWDDNQSL